MIACVVFLNSERHVVLSMDIFTYIHFIRKKHEESFPFTLIFVSKSLLSKDKDWAPIPFFKYILVICLIDRLIFKSAKISEKCSLQAQADVFNCPKHKYIPFTMKWN